MFRNIVSCTILLLAAGHAQAQQLLSQQEAVSKALVNNKNVQAAFFQVKEQKQLLKSAVNLPNPELFVESPTGNFYTPSITQSIEFPTVYGKQYQLQKQQIVLAEKTKILTQSEVKYQVRQLYLLLQYADTLQKQLYLQDTLYERISYSAGRQFDAGQIDFLQKTFVESQYGEVHNQYLQMLKSVNAFNNQLRYVTGVQDSLVITPFNLITYQTSALEYGYDSSVLLTNPSLLISKQTEVINEKYIELQKNKALPGLAFGYFNQGEKSTPVGNRFRFGITIPFWFWQYRGNINSAKIALQVSQQQTGGLQQQLTVQLLQASNELMISAQSISYYQTSGLKKANDIITTAKRFLETGEIDYINYLRNINDAYSIQLKYLEAAKNYSQSVLTINYLTGTL